MASSGEFYVILSGSAASCRKYVVTWSSTQNAIANTTTITCTHKLVCDYSWATYLNSISVVCNISGVSSSLSGINVSVGTSGGTVALGTTTHIISHNADGTKHVDFSSTFNPNGSSGFTGTASADTQLPTIDRTAPSVSVNITNITSSGCKISATSSVVADKWEYSLNGGSSYTQFSTTEGTAASVTLSSLSPNTSYTVRVRARKKTNQVSGVSEAKSVKTLGGSIINSISTVIADNNTVSVPMNVTVYDQSFYHKLAIKKGNTTILTTSAFQMPSGTSAITKALTSSERTTLLSAMSTIKSFTATITLTTYTTSSCTTQVGSVSTNACTIQTTAANSAPTFTNFSYTDTRGIIGGLTESSANNNILVQTYSLLQVTATAGTAKNGASIVSYSASIGDASKTSTSTQIDVGAVESTGDIELTVTCTDSRGYATSVTKTVKVLKYASPKCTNFTLRRKNEIEDTIQLSFNGSFSSLKPVSAEVNELKVVGFAYKQTSTSNWGSTYSIKNSVSVSGSTFSFSTTQLMISSTQELSLDENTSYDFKLLIQDALDSYTSCLIEAVITQGTPLISLRKRDGSYNFPRVGINNPSPQEALDVSGNIKASGTLKALGLDLTEAVVIYYGTCSTEAATQAKAVTLMYSAGFRLVEGVSIRIKFSNGQTYNGQPTLNVNSTGAKNIVSRGTTAGNRYMWLAGEIIDFVYDGTNWCAVDSGIASTTYYGVTKLSSSVSSTSTSTAATPAAVKAVNDRITYGTAPMVDGFSPLDEGVFYAQYS